MSNALYFCRRAHAVNGLSSLIREYNLEKSFVSKKETIYRGEQMLVTVSKRYLLCYLYEDQDASLRGRIQDIMYCKDEEK
jgi:hypothetical protein